MRKIREVLHLSLSAGQELRKIKRRLGITDATEARFDDTQAVPPGQPGERHRGKLIPAGGANPIVHLILLDKFAKQVAGQM